MQVNKNYTNYKEEFERIYNDKILASLLSIEKERQEKLVSMIFNECLILILFAGSLFLFVNIILYLQPIICAFCLLTVLFFFVFLCVYPSCKNYAFANKLKSMYLAKILNIIGKFEYGTRETHIPIETIKKSGLFTGGTEVIYDDCFSGNYKGVDLKINEINLSAPQNANAKGALPFKIFRGVIINMAFNKTIKSNTLVYSKEDIHVKGWRLRYMLSAIIALCIVCFVLKVAGIIMSSPEFYAVLILVLLILAYSYITLAWAFKEKLKNVNGLNELKLEDTEFNKRYSAFSSDQVEGRYLITPAFMERFKNIQTAFGTKQVKCSFFDNSLMLAISTGKNVFELGNLYTPLNTTKHMDEFFDELLSILVLVDHFKLNESTKL